MRFYKRDFAQGYESRLSREAYPGALLPAILKHLDKNNSIIDIGAGTGFVSLELLKLGFSVTALEPSKEMLRIFQAKIDNSEFKLKEGQLNVVNKLWKDFSGTSYDVALSVHSLYPMEKDLEASLEKMLSVGKKSIVVVRKKPLSYNLSDSIRKGLGIKKRNSSAWSFSERVIEFLNRKKIKFHTEDILQTIHGSFSSLSDEAAYYQMHLNLENKEKEINRILKNNTELVNEKFCYSFKTVDTVIVF